MNRQSLIILDPSKYIKMWLEKDLINTTGGYVLIQKQRIYRQLFSKTAKKWINRIQTFLTKQSAKDRDTEKGSILGSFYRLI